MKIYPIMMAALFSASSLFAQFGFGLSVGAKGGFAPTQAVTSNNTNIRLQDSVNEYLVGPTFELRVPLGFAAEVDALYHHADYGGQTTSSGPKYGNTSTWEIPYVAKFRFPIPLLKPFILAGGAYRVGSPGSVDLGRSKSGFVTGLGMELRILRFRASAEGRYVRWKESDHSIVNYPQDQAQVLFGFTF